LFRYHASPNSGAPETAQQSKGTAQQSKGIPEAGLINIIALYIFVYFHIFLKMLVLA
jgi:hypothetical protein